MQLNERQLFTNNATTTLAADALAASNSLTVIDGSLFASPVAGEYQLLTLQKGDVGSEAHEVVKLTQRTGNTLIVDRGYEGVAADFAAGDTVEARLTATTMTDLQALLERQLTNADGNVLSDSDGNVLWI